MIPNNVTRLLASRRIPFEAFELPPQKLGASEAAQHMGVDPHLVYKTIVILPPADAKPVLAVIPGDREVDLKAVAAALNLKKVHLATQHQAEELTGLQTGGISPLALLQRGFRVLLDRAAEQHQLIHISGGKIGLNIRLPVKALVDLTRARIAPISTTTSEDSSPAAG